MASQRPTTIITGIITSEDEPSGIVAARRTVGQCPLEYKHGEPGRIGSQPVFARDAAWTETRRRRHCSLLVHLASSAAGSSASTALALTVVPVPAGSVQGVRAAAAPNATAAVRIGLFDLTGRTRTPPRGPAASRVTHNCPQPATPPPAVSGLLWYLQH